MVQNFTLFAISLRLAVNYHSLLFGTDSLEQSTETGTKWFSTIRYYLNINPRNYENQ